LSQWLVHNMLQEEGYEARPEPMPMDADKAVPSFAQAQHAAANKKGQKPSDISVAAWIKSGGTLDYEAWKRERLSRGTQTGFQKGFRDGPLGKKKRAAKFKAQIKKKITDYRPFAPGTPRLPSTPNVKLSDGFRFAYDEDSGIFVDERTGTMYVCGMRPQRGAQELLIGGMSEIDYDLLASTKRYSDLKAAIARHPDVLTYRGHSAGGALLAAYAHRHPNWYDQMKNGAHEVETFNTPFNRFNQRTPGFQNYQNAFDPFAHSDPGAILSHAVTPNPHGYAQWDGWVLDPQRSPGVDVD